MSPADRPVPDEPSKKWYVMEPTDITTGPFLLWLRSFLNVPADLSNPELKVRIQEHAERSAEKVVTLRAEVAALRAEIVTLRADRSARTP